MSPTDKPFVERLFHATAYEVLAIAICTPVAAWAMEASLPQMGVLTLALSAIAMAWNMVFNAGFDAAQRSLQFKRGLGVRLVHGVLFEAGMFLVAIPLAAWWLDITLWAALLLDAGLLLFFLPYTVAYNWAYDLLRAKWFARRG